MEIISSACYENVKRYWRRNRYQRLNGASKRKLKIARLGSGRRWKLRAVPKLHMEIASPIKLLAKFHDAYIDMMLRLATNIGSLNNKGFFRGKKVAKDQHISMVSSGDEVDSRLLLEIYKKLAASRDMSDFWSNKFAPLFFFLNVLFSLCPLVIIYLLFNCTYWYLSD